MANGELLRKLFQSYKRRDDQAFDSVAQQIVAEERLKRHTQLADDLEHILSGIPQNGARRSVQVLPRQLETLPRDRERDTVLLDVRKPAMSIDDIVLSAANRSTIDAILDEFRRSEILRTYGLPPRRHLLFCGPPGCGKTLCAEVIANELDVLLLHTRFDAIISSYLGETASNLRKVFDFAARGTWVLFFDEVDAIGKDRADATEHGELKRVVNSFLQILDDFSAESMVIAATNHEGMLDPALWRRFDEILYFGPPTPDEIVELLRRRLGAVNYQDIPLHRTAAELAGLSHADIVRICQDALRTCLLAGERRITSKALHEAISQHRRRLRIAHQVPDTAPYDRDG